MHGDRDWGKWAQLKCCLEEAYKKEKEYWSRKARVRWLREGDKNSSYFHAATAERRKRNRIDHLITAEGVECRSENEIAGEIARYFEILFKTEQPKDCEEFLEGIPRTITETMNRNITRPVES